jgi:glucose 1-dehydrogenase
VIRAPDAGQTGNEPDAGLGPHSGPSSGPRALVEPKLATTLSKGGIRMLTRTAGVELAPHGVLVVGVGPGAVITPINAPTLNDPEQLAKVQAAIPLGRLAHPHEIGSVVAFLAGEGATYMTATTVFADGGIMPSSPGL